MTRIKQTILLAASATVAVAAIAFAEAQTKMNAAAPTIGVAAPGYALPDQNGQTHTLAADKGKVVLLAFYPADFTQGCTIEAHSLSDAYPKLKAEGVTVYGVSVQDTKSHKSFCTSEKIPYTLLADTQKTMTTAYGDLIPGAGFANRVTYIIGADGKVAFVDKNVNGHLTTCGDDWAAWVKAHPTLGARAAKPMVSNAVLTQNFPLESVSNAALSMIGPAVVGKPAPDFTLPNVATGKHTSLDRLMPSSKAAVVMFISTRCPVSNAYNERMVSLAKKYSPLGVAFVGIDANSTEPTPEVAAFAKAKGFPFPVLKDAGDVAADKYKAHVTPETYVINDHGVLVYHGRIDNDMDTASVKTHELADALDATLAGKPVVKTQTKAFGCSIKRD